jgi:hypothetical protein
VEGVIYAVAQENLRASPPRKRVFYKATREGGRKGEDGSD